MYKHALYTCMFFAALFFGNAAAHAQRKQVVPFRLTAHNNMSVRAVLNGKDTVNLMFHTAAGYVTVTETAAKKLKSLQFKELTDSVKSWGGGAGESRLSENNTLRMAGLVWKKVSIWENINSGPGTDGKFGMDVFEGRVVAINFDQNTIGVYKALPAQAQKYEKLKLLQEHGNLFVEAACQTDNETFTHKFLIHSGYYGALLLDDSFVNEHRLGDKLKITGEKELRDSYNNVVKTKKAVLPKLRVGSVELADVPVGFFEGAIGRQKMSIMGGDVIKRFNWIIDVRNGLVYITPSSLKSAAYNTVG